MTYKRIRKAISFEGVERQTVDDAALSIQEIVVRFVHNKPLPRVNQYNIYDDPTGQDTDLDVPPERDSDFDALDATAELQSIHQRVSARKVPESPESRPHGEKTKSSAVRRDKSADGRESDEGAKEDVKSDGVTAQ